MKLYKAKLLGGYSLTRDEDWAVPVMWSDDGKMDFLAPVYGEEARLLKDFPMRGLLDISTLAFEYVQRHPEVVLRDEFFVREHDDSTGKVIEEAHEEEEDN